MWRSKDNLVGDKYIAVRSKAASKVSQTVVPRRCADVRSEVTVRCREARRGPRVRNCGFAISLREMGHGLEAPGEGSAGNARSLHCGSCSHRNARPRASRTKCQRWRPSPSHQTRRQLPARDAALQSLPPRRSVAPSVSRRCICAAAMSDWVNLERRRYNHTVSEGPPSPYRRNGTPEEA